MNWLESLIIIFGISLDVFAVMECKGSLVARVDKKQLSIICLIVSIWQLIALFIGDQIAKFLVKGNLDDSEIVVGQAISASIFLALGISLLVKAIKNERISERRVDAIKLWSVLQIVLIGSVYPTLAGVAFGLLQTDAYIIIILMVALSILCVICGMYIGYHFGFIHKTKAYAVGAAFLFIAGADVIIRYFINGV